MVLEDGQFYVEEEILGDSTPMSMDLSTGNIPLLLEDSADMLVDRLEDNISMEDNINIVNSNSEYIEHRRFPPLQKSQRQKAKHKAVARPFNPPKYSPPKERNIRKVIIPQAKQTQSQDVSHDVSHDEARERDVCTQTEAPAPLALTADFEGKEPEPPEPEPEPKPTGAAAKTAKDPNSAKSGKQGEGQMLITSPADYISTSGESDRSDHSDSCSSPHPPQDRPRGICEPALPGSHIAASPHTSSAPSVSRLWIVFRRLFLYTVVILHIQCIMHQDSPIFFCHTP